MLSSRGQNFGLGFDLLCNSNFVFKTFTIFDFKNAVTLNTRLGSVYVSGNITVR